MSFVDVPGRVLNFTKTAASSRLRIHYSDTLGLLCWGSPAYAVWEVRLASLTDPGFPQPAPLVTSIYVDGSGGWRIQPGGVSGYLTGIPPGTYGVWVRAMRNSNAGQLLNGYSPDGRPATHMLEVEEVP